MRPRSEAPARILEAAIDVINTGGEVAIRVHELANSCGVTGPILYRAFGSREGLIEAAQVERYRRTLAGLEPFLDALRACGTTDRFREIVTETATALLDDRDGRLMRANIIGSSTTRPALAKAISALRESAVASVAGALANAQSSGCIRADLDVTAAASWWLAQLDSRIHEELSPSGIEAHRWNSIAQEALAAVLFGDAPAAV